MRASELLLIVRAQNQASGALRRLAGDLRGLSDAGALRERGKSLQIARQQLMASRQLAMNELNSIETGKRAQALSRARLNAENALATAQAHRQTLSEREMTRQASLLRTEAQIQSMRQAGAARAAPTSILGKHYEAAQIQAEKLTVQEGRLAAQMEVADAAIVSQGKALSTLAAKETEAAQRAEYLRGRISTMGERLALNQQQINDNNKALRAIPYDRINRVGSAFQHTARIMEYGGLVLGGTLAVMANHAAKFDTSVTLAATQTRRIGQSFTATAKNSEYLQKSIRGLMTQFPASAEEMSAAAYDIYSSLNVTLPGGTRLLKTFNQAAVAGQASLDEVTQAGITVMNNFRLKVPQVGKAFQTMFAAVRFGRMTFKEFVAMMPQLSPAFAAAGFGLREMASAAAFMTRVMPNTRMAATSLARLTEMLSRKDFIAGAKKMGANITDLHNRLLPLPTIIDRLAKKFPEIGKAIKSGRGDVALQNFFKTVTALGSGKEGTTGTIQGRRAFIFLVTQAKLAHQIYRQVRGDQNEFTTSLKAMEKTTGVRWSTFVNQLKALALEIGSDVVPALLRMEKPLQDVVKWWQNLDAGTRASIARFATYSAVFLLVGGAVTFLAGTFMRLFSAIGRFAGLGGGMIATLAAVAVAVTALQGNLHGLSDILDTIANFTFGSWTGFATTLTIAAVAAVKLTGALRGLAAASAVEGGAAAGGGLLASLLGRGRAARAGFTAARDAGGLRAGIAGAAASAGLLSSSMLVTGGIIAAGIGGLALWKLHMREAAKDAEWFNRNMKMAAAPRQAGDVFQQLGLGVEGLERAKINMREVQRSIAETRKQLTTARGGQRAQLLDQLKSQTLDLMDAQNAYTDAVNKSNRQFNAFSVSLARLGSAGRQFNMLKNQLGDLLRIQERTPQTPGIQGMIDKVRKSMAGMQPQMATFARNLEHSFDGVVRQLSKIENIKLPKGALQDMFKTALGAGRMLKVSEIRAIVKAELDPSTAGRIPGQIGAIFRRVRAQRIKVEIDDKQTAKIKNAQKLVPKALRFPKFTFPDPSGAAKRAHSAVAKVMTPIKQHIQVVPPGNLQAIGASIVSGIQAGVNAAGPVTVQEVVQQSIQKELGIHSPSRWAMDKVGKPIVEGIALGILGQKGTIEKAATASITFFESAAIQKAQDAKKKITDALLIGDISLQAKTLTQFNNAIAKLGRRKVPRELIDSLAALGPDQAKFISQIANMSEKELRRYVKAWQRANAQVKRSMRATADDIKNSIKDAIQQGVDNLQSMFSEISDTQTQNFGGIFDGLDAKVGDGFKQAMDEYNSQMADFQSQIQDLNGQIVDAQKEGQQRLVDAINERKDQLQQAMGALFSGDWLSSQDVQTRIDWGQKLGFDDLQKDLQSQVDKFKRWRADLTSLAAKVPPELAKQLEDLGPDAVDKLDILNNATDDQLKQYVATWQDGQAAISQVANQTTVDTSDITARVNDILKQIDDVTQKMSQIQMPTQLSGQDIINNLKAQQDQWIEYQGVLQQLIDKGLPMDLVEQLQSMGPTALPYMKALNSMTDDQLKQLATLWDENHKLIYEASVKALNTQLQLWFNYGVNIARNIISGIKSQGDYLSDYFHQLIESMLEERGPPPAPPPPNPTNPNPPYPVGGTTVGSTDSAGGGGARANTTSGVVMNVYAQQDESLDAVLSRATFRLTTRTTP